MRWQMLCVASGWEDIYPKVVEFLEAQGRMKFVRPLYRNLYRTGGAGKRRLGKTRDLHLGRGQ